MIKYIFLVLALLFSACSTLEVDSDYKEGYDFSKVKTFAVVHKVKENENTLVIDRIKSAIEKSLKAKGLKEVDANGADLVFLFHLNVTNKTDIYTDYQMVGYGRYGRGVIAVPQSYNYDEAKLIIDAYDPKIKKIVFRVVAVDELKKQKTPQKRKEYINKTIKEILKTFPPKEK
jgi:hypothetical protein